MADHDSDDPRTWPAVKWPGIELVRVRDTPTGDWRLVGLRFIHDGGGRTEVAVSADVLPEIIEAVAQASCWLRWGRYAPKASPDEAAAKAGT